MGSSLMIVNTVSGALGTVGLVGFAAAVLCATVAMIATAREAGGLLAGASAFWLVAVLLTTTFAYGENWMPIAVAVVTLPIGIGVGLAVRASVPVADRALRALRGRPAPLSPAAQAAPWASAEGALAVRR